MRKYNEGDNLESLDGTKFIITSREAAIINCVLESASFHGIQSKEDSNEV